MGGPSSAAVAEEDPSHQFQMALRPLRKALEQGNLEAALDLARHLLDVGGSTAAHEDRKVQFLLSALDAAGASMRVEFAAQVVERFGDELSDRSRDRLSALFERI